jgi:sulfane dehydrogenase subunit SoxC
MTYKYAAAERAYTLLAGDKPILCFGAVTFREAQELTQEQWLKGDLLSHQSNAESLWDEKFSGEAQMAKLPKLQDQFGEPVAGNGLLHRRFFLQTGAAIAGAAAASTIAHAESISAVSPETMLKPGAGFTGYGVPSHWRNNVQRIVPQNVPPARVNTGSSRTPWHLLEGTITPGGLHYVRNHNGTPDIDPEKHTLTIHGMVKQPLVFTLDTLLRYPMRTEIHFMECAGNSGGMNAPQAPQQTVGDIHGLLSGSEWTGVKLSTLLDEAGLDPKAPWILAEGADGVGMSRSVPVWKAMDDAMIALYQNGERLNPSQGYPMRLLLPGYEGNMSVKWLRRIKVTATPTMTKDETSRYTDLQADGKALMFTYPMEVKSVLTRPAPGLILGVRPNSPPHKTNVSLSKPLAFKSFNRPAIGTSTS